MLPLNSVEEYLWTKKILSQTLSNNIEKFRFLQILHVADSDGIARFLRSNIQRAGAKIPLVAEKQLIFANSNHICADDPLSSSPLR